MCPSYVACCALTTENLDVSILCTLLSRDYAESLDVSILCTLLSYVLLETWTSPFS
jgi:hypothetical protein